MARAVSPARGVSSLPGGRQSNGILRRPSRSRRYAEVEEKVETSKTTTCVRLNFDRWGFEPYYTRPMSAGSPDLVYCARLAADAETLERVYELAELPRLRDLLEETRGTLSASFAFTTLASGRAGAAVAIAAILSGQLDLKDRRVGVIVSGGNVDAQRLAEFLRG